MWLKSLQHSIIFFLIRNKWLCIVFTVGISNWIVKSHAVTAHANSYVHLTRCSTQPTHWCIEMLCKIRIILSLQTYLRCVNCMLSECFWIYLFMLYTPKWFYTAIKYTNILSLKWKSAILYIFSYHNFAIHLCIEKYLFLRDTSYYLLEILPQKMLNIYQYASHFGSYVCDLQLSNRTSTSLMLLLLQNVDTEQHVCMYWTPPRLVRECFIGSVL